MWAHQVMLWNRIYWKTVLEYLWSNCIRSRPLETQKTACLWLHSNISIKIALRNCCDSTTMFHLSLLPAQLFFEQNTNASVWQINSICALNSSMHIIPLEMSFTITQMVEPWQQFVLFLVWLPSKVVPIEYLLKLSVY